MKRNAVLLVGLLAVMMLGLVAPTQVYAESELGKSSSELSALYEQRAQEQERVINEHQKMMEQARRRVDPPKVAVKRNRQMVRHCQRIINAAGALRDEYRDLAKWHNMQEAGVTKE